MSYTIPSEMAMGVAARCWCDPETESRIMDPELALAFARRVDGYLDLIETAWGINANANGGWEVQEPQWRLAAERWRDRCHALLSQHGDPA